MRDILGHVGAWAPRPEQKASAVMLDDVAATDEWLRHMREGVQSRLDALYDGISALEREGLPIRAIEPAGAIYLSVRFALAGRAGLVTNDDVRRWVLREAGTAVVPFNAFAYPHEDGWMRLSIGAVSVQQCRDAVQRVGAALRSLPA
jgi:aspartate aminotransferase